MMNISTQYFKSPLGELILGSYGDSLCLCDWRFRNKREKIDRRIQQELNSNYKSESSDIINLTINQLNEYFNNNREIFDLPFLTVGTPFQKRVWNELIKIPYGKTVSYLDLSRKLNNEKAIRAVAAANGANALSIIIPCHRIVGTKKELVGYAGGLDAKRRLLELEKAIPKNSQMKLF